MRAMTTLDKAGLAGEARPGQGLDPDARRFYAAAQMGYPIGAATHLAFLVLFWLLGQPRLAAFNVLSVALWATGTILHRRGHMRVGFLVVCAEAIAHAALASWLVGLEPMFHMYLFVGAVTACITPPSWGRPLRAGIFVAFFGAAVAIYLACRGVRTPLSPGPTAVLALCNFVGTLAIVGAIAYAYGSFAHRLEVALEDEHRRSETLLRNILPEEIARRLKRGEGTIADGFAGASVLFGDICGFTALSAKVSPAEVVGLLDRVFSRIDELVDRHGLEKIKTIGDAYMVVSGIPAPRKDHAIEIADLALDIRRAVEELRVETRVGAGTGTLSMRIGLSTGPVVAGVIGKRKFAYDLWGDTVNTASRMESHGVAGKVQVSEAMWALLKDDFDLEERGEVDVKGKGPMRTFFLVGRKARQGAGA
jgi:class 3 adenylate cyclase